MPSALYSRPSKQSTSRADFVNWLLKIQHKFPKFSVDNQVKFHPDCPHFNGLLDVAEISRFVTDERRLRDFNLFMGRLMEASKTTRVAVSPNDIDLFLAVVGQRVQY